MNAIKQDDFNLFLRSVKDIIKNLNGPFSESEVVDIITGGIQEELYHHNQFSLLTPSEEKIVKKTINILLSLKTIQQITQEHYFQIFTILKEILKSKTNIVKLPVESEYSVELQLKILNIFAANLLEPILDIGCGKKKTLVNFFQKKGKQAFGIDLFAQGKNITTGNWLDFNFQKNNWGTVLAHQSFTNHFHYYHLKKSSVAQEYASCFIRIINSLKPGGSFIYSPGLPYFEDILLKEGYNVQKHNFDTGEIDIPKIGKENFYTVKITK